MKFMQFCILVLSSILVANVSYADSTRDIHDAVSNDQSAAVVSYIVQSGSFGATITMNNSISGSFDLNSTDHLTKVNINVLSFDAVLDGKPVTIIDTFKLHLVANVSNGDCQNVTITEKFFESTDSLIAEGLKKFLVEHADCLVRDYIIAQTGLVKYC